MLDHVSLGARDLTRTADFYAAVLGVLGYREHRRTQKEAAFGPGEAWTFFVYPAESGQDVVGARTHLAFHAKDRVTALACHAAALQRGAEAVREVAERPEFGPDYFGGMFRDPNGHTIEILTRNNP
jgi:catechol 2,3-dioxygenase-like lactoylglutathione lyase family enzyme